MRLVDSREEDAAAVFITDSAKANLPSVFPYSTTASIRAGAIYRAAS